MMARCALCGRLTEPAVMIGAEAVGPKCARRAGLLAKKQPKGSSIRIVNYKPKGRARQPETLDLFECAQ